MINLETLKRQGLGPGNLVLPLGQPPLKKRAALNFKAAALNLRVAALNKASATLFKAAEALNSDLRFFFGSLKKGLRGLNLRLLP